MLDVSQLRSSLVRWVEATLLDHFSNDNLYVKKKTSDSIRDLRIEWLWI